MAWNIFKKKDKKKADSRFKEMSAKLEESLNKVRNRKRETQKKIDELEDWSAQVIIDTYPQEFPNGNMTFYREQYREKALGEYDALKEKYKDDVDKDKTEKCDKIVTGYANHIQLRKSELELYDKLEKKYSDALQEFNSMEIGEKGLTLMGEHEARLREMDDGGKSLVDAMSEQEKYKSLNDALEHEVNYVQQLEELSEKFDKEDGKNIDHTQAFKEELEKITKDI
jgi:hypothetical protein